MVSEVFSDLRDSVREEYRCGVCWLFVVGAVTSEGTWIFAFSK